MRRLPALALVALSVAVGACGNDNPPGPTLQGTDPASGGATLAPEASVGPPSEQAPATDVEPGGTIEPDATLQPDSSSTP